STTSRSAESSTRRPSASSGRSPTQTSSPGGTARSGSLFTATPWSWTPESEGGSVSRWSARTNRRCVQGFEGQFAEVVQNELLSTSGSWDGIPGQTEPWRSTLHVEFPDQEGKTRLVVREGPHPPGTADLGRQAWEMMLPKLDSLLSR